MARRKGDRDVSVASKVERAWRLHEPAERLLRWEHPYPWPSPSGTDEFNERDRAWADFSAECARVVVDPETAIGWFRDRAARQRRELVEHFGRRGVVPSRISPRRTEELNKRLAMQRHGLSEWPATAEWGTEP